VTVRVDCGAATLECLVDGPDDGPLALLAHGFPDCAHSFRHQVAPLTERGWRVVRPFMRGYAPSSVARDGKYDAAALAADLCALAMRFSSRPAVLVGHDWGAIASYAAVSFAPHLFSRLVTIAVPHLRTAAPRFASFAQLRRSWYMGLFQLRGLAERKLAADDFALVDRLWRDWSPGWVAPADELARVKSSMRAREHLAAVLAYYRALPTPSALAGESRKLLVARTPIPSLYVHGVRDGCIGVELADGCEAAYSKSVEVHRIPEAGHFLHLERPAELNKILLSFLDAAHD
jgi:pimeloyl-ACP methyl ester carboxylesterase